VANVRIPPIATYAALDAHSNLRSADAVQLILLYC
jgi:hypothetical protein